MDLAQTNLAWARYPLDDPRMAEFVSAVDRINVVGDRSPGCLWRPGRAGRAGYRHAAPVYGIVSL